MLNIVLYNPEIPQNTGNIARTCVCLDATLHLIHPLGFKIDEKKIRRAGLDYWEFLKLKEYKNVEEFFEKNKNSNFYLLTTKGNSNYSSIKYEKEAYFFFGPESRGLPIDFINKYKEKTLRIPMSKNTQTRSLNLSNTVAIISYEFYRQMNFESLN